MGGLFCPFLFSSFNFELETLLSAEDLCLCHAPGGERFHVIMDVTQGRAWDTARAWGVPLVPELLLVVAAAAECPQAWWRWPAAVPGLGCTWGRFGGGVCSFPGLCREPCCSEPAVTAP